MQQLSIADRDLVSGGSPIALLGLAVTIIGAAGALREFADGLFDGFGRI